jgi:tetratricopeptide (TPR) repeat protein
MSKRARARPLPVSRQSRWPVLLLLIAMAATVVVYLPAIRTPFEFDDVSAIAGNASIRTLSPLVVLHPPPNTSVAGRPVVNLSLAFNYWLNDALDVDQRPLPSGPNKTVGFHVVNLLLHLGCGLLVFGCIRRTARRMKPEGRADWLAATVTALWLLHPIQTEAVNYLVQRTELLVSVCYAGTLYAWIRAWDASSSAARWRWRLAALAICLVGMGSKEVMITAPIVVVLYDMAFHPTSWREAVADRSRLLFYLLIAATSSWTVAMTAANARFSTVGLGLGMPWYRYLYSQCWAITHYLVLTLWPRGLTFDYGQRPVTGLAGVPGALVLVALGVASVVAWRRPSWRWAGFLGAMFFLLLAPSSSVVPIVTEIAAERRIYLALAPVFVLVVVGVAWLLRNRPSLAKPARVAAGTAGLLLAIVAFNRSRLYADPESLWRDTVNKVPSNPRADDNLAALMFYSDPPRLEAAKALYERAIASDSTYVNAWRGLASVAADQDRPDAAEALLRRALAIHPGYVDGVRQLGRQLLRAGHPDRALPYLQQIAAAYPTDTILTAVGVAYLQIGRADSAAVAFRQALEINPDAVDPLRYLGGALVELGQGREAVPVLERLIAAGSRSPTDMGLLSLAYAQAGQPTAALRAADVAVRAAPGDVPVLILAGRAMGTLGRQQDATAYLAKAMQIDPSNREAAAYLGRIRQAGSPARRRR